jgi:hypothetical protein
MVRTQIQFTDAQSRQLKIAAQRAGVSISEFVRRCVDERIGEQPLDRAALYARAEELIGRFEDAAGATDLSSNHDRYLEDAYQ